MIVLTAVKTDCHFCILPGDEFRLSVTDETGHHVMITEVVAVATTIDYVASFRFAAEDGAVLGFHLCGIFANSKTLPEEIKNAKRLNDLSAEQADNFKRSLGYLVG